MKSITLPNRSLSIKLPIAPPRITAREYLEKDPSESGLVKYLMIKPRANRVRTV